MLSQERHERLLAYLNEHKTIKVSDASKSLGVTEKTIRLDLETLEHRKLLKRVHGGAVLAETETSLFPVEGRQLSHADKKIQIAQKALRYIEENEVILLDGGSTARALASLLGEFPLTVLTNDIQVANELYKKEKVQLVMLGGTRLGDSSVIYSQQTLDMLDSMFVRKLFLGTTGVSLEQGLTVLKSYHVDWKRQALKSAKESILLADSTKFGQVGLMCFAQLEELDTVISDDGLAQEYKAFIQNNHMKLL